MITVQRKRVVDAPAERVRALLSDPANIGQWMPGLERVEVLSRNGNVAHLALQVRLPKLGPQRIEGEAHRLEDGVRFVAAEPVKLNTHWTALPHGHGTEVTARLAFELPPGLGMLARLIPQHVIEEQVNGELDRALQRLEAAVR